MHHHNVTRTDPQRTKISDELTHGMHAVEYRPAGGFSIRDPLAETRRCRRIAARVAARVNPFVEILAL